MPREREASERGLLDRLDLLAQACERALPQRAQHAAVDPLRAARAGAELPLEDRARLRELAKGTADLGGADAETAGELDGGEGSVGAREAPNERDERPGLVPEERIGKPRWHDDGHRDGATIALQLEQPLIHSSARGRACGKLIAGQIAEPQEQLVRGVRVSSGPIGHELLELELELRQRVRVEELAQLDLAEELAELRRVHGQGLRAAFGEGRVALVDEVADVLEEERRREGRWRA